MDPSIAVNEACVICHWLDQQAWGAFENYLPGAAAASTAAAAAAGAAVAEFRSIPGRAWEGFTRWRGTTDGLPDVRGVRPTRRPRTTPLDLSEIADSYEGRSPDEVLDYFEQGLGRSGGAQ